MLENALGSVVTVAVYETEETMKPLGFRGNNAEMAYSKALDLTGAKGSGSGFVITRNGKNYVITNAHVIQQATDKEGSIYVYSINYTKYLAKLVGGDSFYDIAVLELEDKTKAEITPIEFRKSEILIGEQVYAIGNPLGEYPYTVTTGIISAKNRVRDGLTGKFGFLQSSATVIWGNSGGPLVDAMGTVVGINSQIAFADNGGKSLWQPQINFALEAGLANKLVDDIINNDGLIKRAYLGIEVSKRLLDYRDANKYSITAQETNDPLPIISGVIVGSPAAKSLANYVGYTILSINGEKVRNIEEVLGQFEKTNPTDEVVFELSKMGTTTTVKVKTATSNATTNAAIAENALQQWGCKTAVDNDGIRLTFSDRNKYSSFQKKATEVVNVIGSTNHLTSDVLFGDEWLVVASGIVSRNNSMVWKIKDNADLGTALRLCATTGIVDFVLFRKGSSSRNQENYLQKRFILSGSDFLQKQTLWY